MPWTNEHLQWLQLIDTKKTADGKDIEIYELITSPINNLNYGIILYGKNRCKKIITQRVV